MQSPPVLRYLVPQLHNLCSSLSPFHLKMEANQAFETQFFFERGQWTVSSLNVCVYGIKFLNYTFISSTKRLSELMVHHKVKVATLYTAHFKIQNSVFYNTGTHRPLCVNNLNLKHNLHSSEPSNPRESTGWITELNRTS